MFNKEIDLGYDDISLEDVFIQLLESSAKEETALSTIIKAEAANVQNFVGQNLNFPSCPTIKDIMNFSRSTSDLIDSIVMKEWLLLRKLESVIHLETQMLHTKPCSTNSCTENEYTEETWNDEDEG